MMTRTSRSCGLLVWVVAILLPGVLCSIVDPTTGSTTHTSINIVDDNETALEFATWMAWMTQREQQQSPPPGGGRARVWEVLNRDPDHDLARRELIWSANQQLVAVHNTAYHAGQTAWKMTMWSPFAALTADEFTALYLMEPQHCSATTATGNDDDDDDRRARGATATAALAAASPVLVRDWRTKGIMTPVKDQGHCGSCWTFSTSGCLEAHTCLAHDQDCSHWSGLSEQQLVDCAGDYNNDGCAGGLPSQAYEYLKYNHGMDTEDSYRYTAQDGPQCLATAGTVGATVAAVVNITSGDEAELVQAIDEIGPVSIAYQVSPDFRLYAHGVYDSYDVTTNTTLCNSTNMDVNHAVVAIGLGTTADSKHNNHDDGGIPYYIVRNSWGASWGMEGHFWMKRGENLCGVSDCASFPIVPTPTDKKETLADHEVKEDEAAKSISDENTVQKLPAGDTIDVDNITKVTVPSVASSTMEQMVYLRQKKE